MAIANELEFSNVIGSRFVKSVELEIVHDAAKGILYPIVIPNWAERVTFTVKSLDLDVGVARVVTVTGTTENPVLATADWVTPSNGGTPIGTFSTVAGQGFTIDEYMSTLRLSLAGFLTTEVVKFTVLLEGTVLN